MSDDGKTLDGTWVIVGNGYSVSGRWTAYRTDENDIDTKEQETKEKAEVLSGQLL